MHRRALLRLLSLLPVAALGPAAAPRSDALAATRKRLIDVHAHIFNATDLPARRFLKIVFLHKHSEQATEKLLALDDPDVLDWILELFIRVTSGRAPSAKDETALLDGAGLVVADVADFKAASEHTIQVVADFLNEPPPSRRSSKEKRRAQASGAIALKRALLRAGGVTPDRNLTLEKQAATSHARKAFNSDFDVGVYLRWFTLFSIYRHALADHLANSHAVQGFEPLLIAPAVIDYSKWLGEEVASPLADQIEVMGRIARRAASPAVHGYASFDPLRGSCIDVWPSRAPLPWIWSAAPSPNMGFSGSSFIRRWDSSRPAMPGASNIRVISSSSSTDG